MRFWMLFLWLSLLTPVRADEAACLASPDQACLLDLAAARALAQEEVRDTVGDLLAIAAIEERARYGLGMIRQDEIFVQLGPLPTGGDIQPRPSAQRTGPLAGQRGERNVLPVAGRESVNRIGY